MTDPRPLLVLVHPGSACGSADFHHGRSYASAEREALADRLRGWQYDLVVVDSDLSDEIRRYPVLMSAIESALARAASTGHGARLLACDDQEDYDGCDWVSQVRDHVLALGTVNAIVTGAWHHVDDDHGCVNAVYDVLTREGLKVDIDDSALPIDLETA